MKGVWLYRNTTVTCRLDKLDLKPEETPNIAFRADVAALRDAVKNFGRVDARGLPLENVFVDPENSSRSLPRTFEDYGDAEHHVLYKTVEEVRKEKNKDCSVSL